MKTFRMRPLEDGTVHTVSLCDGGTVVFHDHPDAFNEAPRERGLKALGGEPAEMCACLLLAERIRGRKLVSTPRDGEPIRELLSLLRGLRIGRKLRRQA